MFWISAEHRVDNTRMFLLLLSKKKEGKKEEGGTFRVMASVFSSHICFPEDG